MKSISAGLLALFNSRPTNLLCANLYTITLASGTILRYTDFDQTVVIGGDTFVHNGPQIQRTSTKISKGFEVDTVDVSVTDNPLQNVTIANVPIIQAFRQKVFDGAWFFIQKAYSLPSPISWQGPLDWFYGRIGEITELTRIAAKFQIRSVLALLDVQMPRNLIQPPCARTLFDPGCTLNRVSFKVSSSAASLSTVNTVYATLAQATGYFDLGMITFTSGNNAGASRMVRKHVSGSPAQLLLSPPLLFAPLAGDTFDVYPGCDKTQATCQSKFNNLIHFSGEPYVPVPETSL